VLAVVLDAARNGGPPLLTGLCEAHILLQFLKALAFRLLLADLAIQLSATPG